MLNNVRLQTKLLVFGIVMTVTPLLITTAITVVQNARMVTVAEEGTTALAYTDLDHIAENIYGMCEAQQELLQISVDHSLNVARDVLEHAGQVSLGDDTITWQAINQYTKASSSVMLPKMMVGETWLGQNRDISTVSPVVDKTMSLTDATCSIFQRMNEAGDMLRVCTNVQKTDGTRAIGMYIPRTNPDGTPNPVVSTVLRGETFRGRAYVVNRWYITAYEPIFDESNQVTGVLYVGIPQESVASVRKAIMGAEVGKTGYVYVLDSKGNYVISQGGKRDGECIWEARDADGTLFIQEICAKAQNLKPGETSEQRYPWKNKNDAVAREKVVRLVYFEPWDWIIGVGSYIDEFYVARDAVTAIGRTSNALLAIIAGVSLLIAAALWYLIARGIAGRIASVVERLSNGADQVTSASAQVSSSSQSLAQGATEQAAGLEETSSSLEEMASMTKQNADNAQQANVLALEARRSADTGSESMQRMDAAIHEIQRSSDETAKIIKVIDDIAFQTNLLALNAAVEAARAGEAGKGFAVVAEEVRNLAMRSADAAKNTSNMIEESVKNARNGVEIATEVGKVLEEIVQSVGKTTDLVSEIAAASQEQAQGIDQINNAVTQMDRVTQQNAANAEESASASEELSAQAESMYDIVAQLVSLVGTGASATGGPDTGRHRSPGSLAGRRANRMLSVPAPLAQSDHTWHRIAGTGTKPSGVPDRSPAENAIPLDDETDLEDFNN